ncbi:hypothetical protein [Nitrososphaera viennensis]|uniref:Uncharacterized protein n=2 Tax=Nitrososphaera viennensis TaxID=1034015 RepID=A0A060HR02_9ARCH|nr:hypothetical protein [Nitrososphaera viennensis]AIC15607.1 hypothetical protein NVIE_013680 [Nitrososphaera viennensis EN76]UVS70482.1 hypothetical protein NWT39_06780 [Nitrososphaera viennensis]
MSGEKEKEKEFWIKLLVKYKGKCAVCGKEIPQGEYALWSRASKAIKHVKCEVPVVQQQQQQQQKEEGEEEQQEPEALLELKCFVCGKNAGCAACSLEADCNRAMVSQACICESCLSGPDAYGSYQQAFLAKIAGKVKM